MGFAIFANSARVVVAGRTKLSVRAHLFPAHVLSLNRIPGVDVSSLSSACSLFIFAAVLSDFSRSRLRGGLTRTKQRKIQIRPLTAVMSSCCPTSTEEVLTLPIPSPQTPNLRATRAPGRQFVLSTITRKQAVVDSESGASPEIRVLVADRDPMSGDLLAHALAGDGICEAHAVNSAELLETLETRPTDVAVIASDLTLGPRNAFDLAHAVNRSYPNVQIVMILNQSDPDTVINAFRSGARGVFSRTQPMLQFLDCVQHVHKGYLWAGGEEAGYLLDIIRNLPALSPLTGINCPSLTERELQVVRLAARGKTNRAIAAELSLSEHTVKNYLFRSFEKLGVSTRVELLFYLTMRGHSFSPAGADAV